MNHKTEVTRKQSTSNFSINGHFLPPDTHTYGKKCSFFGKFGVHYFFVTSVLWFVFLRYYRRVNIFTFSPSRGSHLTFQSPDPYAQSKVFLEEHQYALQINILQQLSVAPWPALVRFEGKTRLILKQYCLVMPKNLMVRQKW